MIRQRSANARYSGPVALIALLTMSISTAATFGEFAVGQLGWAFTRDLGVPLEAIGTMTALMFVAGGAASIPMGWVVDRFSPRLVAPVQICSAAIVLGVLAVAPNELSLMCACAAIGVVMTLAGPLTNRITVDYLPRRSYAQAIGWRSVGPQVAALLAGLSFGGLADLVPWQLVVVGWVGAILAFAAFARLALVRSALWGVDDDHEERIERTANDPIVWWVMGLMFFTTGASASIGAFLPLYALDEVGLPAHAAGFSVALVAAVSVASRFAWVTAYRDHRRVQLLLLAGILSVAASCLLVISQFAEEWVFWTSLVLLGATSLGAAPLAQIVVVHASATRQIGRMSAYSGVAIFAGLAFQPWLMGVLSTHVGFAASWNLMTVSNLLGAATVVGYAVWHRARRDVIRR